MEGEVRHLRRVYGVNREAASGLSITDRKGVFAPRRDRSPGKFHSRRGLVPFPLKSLRPWRWHPGVLDPKLP